VANGPDKPVLQSSNVAFEVPVDALGTVDVVLSRAHEPQTLKFSVNSGADTLKLRTGFYFIALRETGSGRNVDWSNVRIREGALPRVIPADSGVLEVDGLFGARPVDFSYLVIQVGEGHHVRPGSRRVPSDERTGN
jgi:hypothetical protein